MNLENLFGIDQIGEALVKAVSPGLVAMLPAAAAATRGIVRAVRQRLPQIDGNYAQTVAGLVSVSVVTVIASTNGVFADGTDLKEVAGLLIIAAMNGLIAIGWNEALTDRNPEREEDAG